MSKLQQKMELAQRAEVEFIAFSGGGAKGAIYSGVHQALKASGTLDGVKSVAGSSAGAITAAFVATGIEPADFEKLSRDTNLKGLLGKGFIVNKDGKPLYELLAKTISKNVSSFLDTTNIPEICTKRLAEIKIEQESNMKKRSDLLTDKAVILIELIGLPEQEADETNAAAKQQISNKISLLKEQAKEIKKSVEYINSQIMDQESQSTKIQSMRDNQWQDIEDLKIRCDQGDKIYFKDIALLRTLDPVRFKDLLVTAVRRDTGELEIFSATTTPDVEIALACRASASIPVVFKPVAIDGHKYVDGGYRDNVPTKYFTNQNKESDIEDVTDNPEKIAKAKEQGRTLAFAFGGDKVDDKLHVAIYSAKKIHGPDAIIKFLMDVIFKFIAKVGGVFSYSETEKDTSYAIREDALNTVPLDTKNIGTLSFDEAQRKAEYLHVKGYIETMGHLQNHEIGRDVDKHYVNQKFLLGVYEQLEETQSVIQPWSAKVIISREVKSHELLSFAKPEKWIGQDPQKILEEYIVLAATQRGGSNDTLGSNTNTITQLVAKLNAKDTPLKVKKEFIKLLDIDIMQSPKFDKAEKLGVNVAKFEFKSDHFNSLLQKNKARPSLSSSNISKVSSDVIKNIASGSASSSTSASKQTR